MSDSGLTLTLNGEDVEFVRADYSIYIHRQHGTIENTTEGKHRIRTLCLRNWERNNLIVK